MNIHFFASSGAFTDAGGWYIGADGKIHRVPGWDPEAKLELVSGINIIRNAANLKQPGLADSTIKGVMGFVQGQLDQHLKGGGVLVLG